MADEKLPLKPIDPEISIYPNRMSERRARFEAKRARSQGYRLPAGHPYRIAPEWVPYRAARLIGCVDRLLR